MVESLPFTKRSAALKSLRARVNPETTTLWGLVSGFIFRVYLAAAQRSIEEACVGCKIVAAHSLSTILQARHFHVSSDIFTCLQAFSCVFRQDMFTHEPVYEPSYIHTPVHVRTRPHTPARVRRSPQKPARTDTYINTWRLDQGDRGLQQCAQYRQRRPSLPHTLVLTFPALVVPAADACVCVCCERARESERASKRESVYV